MPNFPEADPPWYNKRAQEFNKRRRSYVTATALFIGQLVRGWNGGLTATAI
jgi:hypothetical protein